MSGWGDFTTPATGSSVMTRTVTCEVCGHRSNTCNLVYDFEQFIARVVCSFCRNPLKEKKHG
ncbi:MAG TPA: hypothetical protein VNH41_00425 [Steroidobacteraceae bacterium]|nr:hypothetical protein [Steroidobacteraceae bacterium]